MKNKKARNVSEIAKQPKKVKEDPNEHGPYPIFSANQIKRLFEGAVINNMFAEVHQEEGPNEFVINTIVDCLSYTDLPNTNELEKGLHDFEFMVNYLDLHGIAPIYEHGLISEIALAFRNDPETGKEEKGLAVTILLNSETMPCFVGALAEIESIWEEALEEECSEPSKNSFKVEGNQTVN